MGSMAEEMGKTELLWTSVFSEVSDPSTKTHKDKVLTH